MNNKYTCPVCGLNCHPTFTAGYNKNMQYALEHGGKLDSFLRSLGAIVTVCIETAHHPGEAVDTLSFLAHDDNGVRICKSCAFRIDGFARAVREYANEWGKAVRKSKHNPSLAKLPWRKRVDAVRPEIDMNRFVSLCLHYGDAADPWRIEKEKHAQIIQLHINPDIENDVEALDAATKFWHKMQEAV